MIGDKISSGISIIDDKYNGISQGFVLCLFGNHHYIKNQIVYSFINACKKNTLIVTSNKIPEKYILDLNSDRIIFLDAITWRYKRIDPKIKMDSKYFVNNLADLNNLLSKITLACKENENINTLVFDSPSNLLFYSTPGKEQVYRFLELLFTYTRSKRITVLFTIHPDIHDKIVNSTMKFLSDIVLEVKKEGNINQIRILEMLDDDFENDWKIID